MGSNSPPAKEKPPSRWRKFLKRTLLGLLILLALAVVFHRPLLRWTLNWAAPRLAESAGYDLKWNVQGSILSDVTVRDLTLRGPSSSVLRSVTLRQANANYNLWTLLREGPAHFLHGLTLTDATIELDTRIAPAPPTEKKPGKSPPDVWAERIDLRNVDLRILTEDGPVELKRFSLQLDEHAPGTLAFDELIVPASNLHLTRVSGKTSIKERTVTLTDLVLTPDITIAQLSVDVADLDKAAAGFQIRAQSGGGTLDAGGRVENLGPKPSLDVKLHLVDLPHSEIRRWVPLPDDLAWHIDDAELQLRGPPTEPRQLEATLALQASGLRAAGVNGDRLQARATITRGELQIQSLTLQAGANTAEVTGATALPATWREMNRTSAELRWKLDGPKLEDFFYQPFEIAGALQGEGTLALKDGKLGGAEGTIKGSQLRYRQWTFASLTGDVSTDAQTVKIKSLAAKFDDRNSLTVDGQIQLAGRQPADLTWRAELADATAIARTAGWKDADSISAETLSGGGTVRFEIAALREKNLRTLAAEGSVNLGNFTWLDRRLQGASLEFSVKDARAEVRKLEIVFDARNRGLLSGHLHLENRQPWDLAWRADLRDVSTIPSWLAWNAKAPRLDAGSITAQGKASGALADLREKNLTTLVADATLGLAGLASREARFDRASLEVTCREGRVELRHLDARFDPQNRLAARGHVMLQEPREFTAEIGGKLLQLKNLSAWVKMFNGPVLTGGSATISWNGSGSLSTAALKGNGSLSITELKLADRPAFSVSLATEHDGRRAQVTGLRASTGNFRVEAQASISDTDASIAPLSVYSGDLPLVNGTVQLPLALSQTPRPAIPLDSARPLNVSLHVAKLDLAKLFAAFGMKPPVTGIADGDVELRGTLPELQGTVALSLTAVRAAAIKGKLEPASLRLDASLAQDRLSLRASVDQKPLRALTLTGALPLDAEKIVRQPAAMLDSEMEARVVLPQSDLSIVRRFVPALAELQGTVEADVQLSGPLRSPHWRGALRAEAPRATFEKTPMDIKDLRARVSFVDKRITLDDVSAMLAGGEMRATGGVDVTDLTNPLLDLRLDAREALIVRNESLSARANAAVTCQGSLTKAVVSGRADLVRCRVFKEIEFIPLSLPNQLPPAPPPVQTRSAPSLPAPFDQWTFDLDIATHDAIRLLGNVLNGSATTDLHLGGTGAAPELVGEVTFEGARVRLPNSKLTVTRGKLIFTKDKPFEPTLDVLGESLVGNYEITVNAYGPALKPKVRFTSSPPLSESEIATLLATGTVGGGEQAAAGAAANAAAFQVLSKAYRSVFNKAAPKRYDEEPPRLTFSFSPLSTGTSAPGVSATYEISPRLQATGAVTERGTFRGMLYYMVRLR